MNKKQILNWVKYASQVLGWLTDCVSAFPEKKFPNEAGNKQEDSANRSAVGNE
jgi:hypothetical protein